MDHPQQENDALIHDSYVICPHSKKTLKINVLGVIAYYHEEKNDSCALMNKFGTNNQDILKEIAVNSKLDMSPTMRAALYASHAARMIVYGKLSKAQPTELVELLEKIVKIYRQSRNPNVFLQEFITTFGPTAIQNLKIVLNEDFSKMSNSRPTYLPMYNLGPQHIKNIDKTIEEATERHKQTLEDIF